MRLETFAFVASAFALAGCGDDSTAGTASSTSAASTGAGGMGTGGGSTGSGGGDPCAAAEAAALSTVGCNGPPLGSGVAPNDFGGLCTPDPAQDPAKLPLQGSCTAATDGCASSAGSMQGICVRPCDPAATYVSTGTCPAGSRCFTIDAASSNAYCFPDCNSGSDCTTMTCDGEGGCAPPP